MIARLGPALVAAALITVPFATGLTAAQAAPPTTITLAEHHGGDQDQGQDPGQDQGQWPGQGQSQWPGQGQNQWPGQGQNDGQGQRQPQDDGDWWFTHHCRELHEWWQPRCQRDGGDMWHRGNPPSLGY